VSNHLLLEAAVRSGVMGAIIFAALRLMRIEQVSARRTAWLLALAAALLMPLLVGTQIGPRLLPDVEGFGASRVAVSPEVPGGPASAAAGERTATAAAGDGVGEDSARSASDAGPLLAVGYCIVAAVLSLRLCVGVGWALRLRNQAERIQCAFDPQLDIRLSRRIASPITVASSVLLPANYARWDEPTLHMVLAHERAHVRQGDFYVQLLAGAHCAVFWFNPFSWWLRRQLSDLGEALSDRAAVEHAPLASRRRCDGERQQSCCAHRAAAE